MRTPCLFWPGLMVMGTAFNPAYATRLSQKQAREPELQNQT